MKQETPYSLEDLRKLSIDGMAEKYGVSATSVRNWRKKHGLGSTTIASAIRQHIELLGVQSDEEVAALAGTRHPRRSDPFHSFAHYPSFTLDAHMVLQPGPLLPADKTQRQAMLALQLERPIYEKLKQQLNTELLAQVIEHVALQTGGFDIHTLQTSETTEYLQRQVGWLIKAGLVRL